MKQTDASCTIPPLCKPHGNGTEQLLVTDKEKADFINDYFVSVSTVDDTNAVLPPLTYFSDNSLSSFDVTESEIHDIICSLNTNKAAGPDCISHRMLKAAS